MAGVPELDCVDVHEALFAGRPLSAAEADHVATCPLCSRAMPEEPLDPSFDLFAEVNASVQSERGLVARARSLSTPERVLAGVLAAGVLAVGMALTRPRWAFGPVPMDRVGPELAALLVAFAAVLWLALRPLQSAPPDRRLVLGAVAVGLLVPAVLAFTAPAAPLAEVAAQSMPKPTLSCFLFGALPGTLFVLALRALDRGAHGVGDAALLAAVGGGLCANIALELHCPSAAPLHLLFGHATVGVVLAIAYLAYRRSARPATFGS
jgi:hypothetical protein